MKNEGNINRVLETSKIPCLHGFFLLQPTVDLSPFEQKLEKSCTIKGSISTTYAYNESLQLLISQY